MGLHDNQSDYQIKVSDLIQYLHILCEVKCSSVFMLSAHDPVFSSSHSKCSDASLYVSLTCIREHVQHLQHHLQHFGEQKFEVFHKYHYYY